MTKGREICSVDTLDKGMIHIPGKMELEDVRFRHGTQKGAQFKIYRLFIFGIFLFIFPDFGWLWVTGTTERETMDKGVYGITG